MEIDVNARWLEDFEVGQSFRSPGKTFTEAEIVDFAFTYDPQPFHMDKGAAEASIYGGLIASGWQLGAVAFRLLTMMNLFGRASLGSPGVDNLRWLKPVRPGDTITTVVTVRDVRPSRSKPDRGVCYLDYRIENQHGEVVMTLGAPQLLRRRPGEANAEGTGETGGETER